MLKPKRIVVPFFIGFVLSFLISIISTKHFGPSLLRALIFGLVFAGGAIGITFLWRKFLDAEGVMSEDSSPSSAGKAVGGHVDITLSDENLTEDGSGLRFSVDLNRQKMNEEEKIKSDERIKDSEPLSSGGTSQSVNEAVAKAVSDVKSSADNGSSSSSAESSSSAFKPVNLGEKIDSFPSPEEIAESKKSARSLSREADIKEVEELPDIAEMSSIGGLDSQTSVASESGEGSGLDSDFMEVETATAASLDFGKGKAEEAKSHDVETMAKAISTLLKKDD